MTHYLLKFCYAVAACCCIAALHAAASENAAKTAFKPLSLDSLEIGTMTEEILATATAEGAGVSEAEIRQAIADAVDGYNQAVKNLDMEVVATMADAAQVVAAKYNESKDREAEHRHRASDFAELALLFERGSLRQQDALEAAREGLADLQGRLARGESPLAVSGVSPDTFARAMAAAKRGDGAVEVANDEDGPDNFWFCQALKLLLQREKEECERTVESTYQTCMQSAFFNCPNNGMGPGGYDVPCDLTSAIEACERERNSGSAVCMNVYVSILIGNGCMNPPSIP